MLYLLKVRVAQVLVLQAAGGQPSLAGDAVKVRRR
jgi:hypothetical protein